MKEITIIYDLPIVFTKDSVWLDSYAKNAFKPGQIVLLPDDAVLVVPPQIIEQTITKKGEREI